MDILNEMTKNEIIDWVHGQAAYILNPPKRSDLLWYRWLRQEKKISDRRKANIEHGELLDMSKRDKLAKEFNSIKDTKTKLLLMERMKPYEDRMQIYLDETRAIMKAEKKINKLYKRIETERIKENKNNTGL